MTRDRLVSVFVVLSSLTIATVVVWLLFFRPVHEHTTVRDLPVVVSSPLTPLQVRRARRSAVGRSPDSRVSSATQKKPTATFVSPGARIQPAAPTRRRRAARHKAKRPAGSGGGSAPAPSPSPTPPAQRPPVDVQVPAPVTVCARGVGGVNC